MKDLRAKIKELNAQCVFSEPQFEPALIKTLIEGSNATVGVLDPIGSNLEPGPDAYFKMMEHNVTAIVDCLK